MRNYPYQLYFRSDKGSYAAIGRTIWAGSVREAVQKRATEQRAAGEYLVQRVDDEYTQDIYRFRVALPTTPIIEEA